MRSAIPVPVRYLGLAVLILPAPALGVERMVATGELAKFAPAEDYRVSEPLPAANRRPERAHDFRISEEANPEISPFVRRCDALAADPGDATRPEGVAGVALEALDSEAARRMCERAHATYPTHARSAFNLGRVHMAAGEPGAAVVAFTAAANEAHPLAALTVAQLYQRQVVPDRGPADALPFYAIAAEAGVLDAQEALATLLTDGAPGLEPDPAEGARWFRVAAEQNSPKAAFELGWAFENGFGVPQDPITAARWYQRAIDKGDVNALNNLGYLYANGIGVPRDEARAVALYRQAADQGVAAAMSNLGWMLENGIGTGQNVHEAVDWYNRSASLGEPQAMLNLGWLYLSGFDMPADANAALGWFKRAYEAGRTDALSYIGELYETDPVLRDPAQAARYYVQALQSGDSWPARRGAGEWDGETAREMQNALFEAGAYQGPFDAAIGEATQAAMNALLPENRQGS
ncbi:MAG: hypothetical protein CSA74_01885 [Rhodobacterales bacterium]|nr:MAG: hypothetical protein CSA74_01885 [Rhodobacterales bacterium]